MREEPSDPPEPSVNEPSMHEGEVHTDAALVRKLVSSQFPEWSELPVSPVRSMGTVNAIYRLGDELCVRLPRVSEWAEDLERECRWLPKLAPYLSLEIPEPVAVGKLEGDYPFVWAVYRWLEGDVYSGETVKDETRAATDLANFVSELRRIEVVGNEPGGGREPLRDLDKDTRGAISDSRDLIHADAALAAWDDALGAPEWDGEKVWVHADLLPPNLLVRDGRLVAVIDFGSAGVGDPAADIIPAWSVFGEIGRHTFRSALCNGLGAGDGIWRRARGYALHQAAMIIPYYRETNPQFVAMASRTVRQVLLDFEFENTRND